MRTEFGVVRSGGCACRSCRRNCMFVPGFLIPADLLRMIPADHDPLTWAELNLEASPGAIVSKGGEMFRIPTLVMAAQPNGYCIHYRNRRCMIWETSPFGCAFFGCDAGPEAQQKKLSNDGLYAVYEAWHQEPHSLYRVIWEHLERTGHQSEGPEVKRARMAETE